MPALEHLTVKVTLTVEVDGHTLTFAETEGAKGPRCHGFDPPHSYSTSDTLEGDIRGTVDDCADQVARRAGVFLRAAYPVCGDNHAGPPLADDDVDPGSPHEYRNEGLSHGYRGSSFLPGNEVPGER